MGVINRTLDQSVQKQPLQFQVDTISNGQTGIIAYISTYGQIKACQLACAYQAASPVLTFNVLRFIPGTGYTAIPLGSSFTMASLGTSGVGVVGGVSLPGGASVMMLAPNDQISYLAGGGTTVGIFGLSGSFIFQPAQDIETYLGGLT